MAFWPSLSVFFISLMVARPLLARQDLCVRYPTGGVKILQGELMDSQGTLNLDHLAAFKKRQIPALTIADLGTGRRITIPRELRALPVARNQGFNRIAFRGFDEQKNQLKILDETGRVLQTLFLPTFKNDPLHNDYYQFRWEEQGRFLVMSSSKNIAAYDFGNQRWVTLFAVESTASGLSDLGWMNSRTDMVNSIVYKNRVVFKQSARTDESGESEFRFVVLRLDDQKELFGITTSSHTSRLLEGRFLIFDEISQLRVWDLESGETVSLPLGVSSIDLEFFEGPFGSFGVIEPRSGQVFLYTKSGRLLRTFELGPLREVIPLPGSSLLFIRKVKDSENYLFDPRTGTLTLWPEILGGAMNGIHRQVQGTHLYLNLYPSISDKPHLLRVDLESRCWAHQALAALGANSQRLGAAKDSILSLLALENKVPKVDRPRLVEALQRNSVSFDKARSYVSLVMTTLDGEQKATDSWRWHLAALSSGLKQFPSAEKERLIDGIAIKIGEKMRHVPLFMDAPTSKIANIVADILKPLFGLSSLPRTDFTLLQQGETAYPMIFGTDPIDDDPGTLVDFGFYAKILPPLWLGDRRSKTYDYQWQHHGKKWRARGQAQIISLTQLIQPSPSINYPKLWADGRLVGAMVISSNITEGFETLARKMIEYFQAEGFDFGWPTLKWPQKQESFWEGLRQVYLFPRSTQRISNGKQWLKGQIESGVLDYWVKEAHSGGNDEVIWLAKNNLLLKGSKLRPDGRKEEIYLLFPESVDPYSAGREVPFQDHEYRDALKKREKLGGADMVYVNGSCWSTHRARQEIIAAQSPLLVEIPTRTSAWTFTNKTTNHGRELLDMIRKGKSYEEMRQRLDAIKESPNPFIFPDDVLYETSIWKALHEAIDFSVEVSSM